MSDETKIAKVIEDILAMGKSNPKFSENINNTLSLINRLLEEQKSNEEILIELKLRNFELSKSKEEWEAKEQEWETKEKKMGQFEKEIREKDEKISSLNSEVSMKDRIASEISHTIKNDIVAAYRLINDKEDEDSRTATEHLKRIKELVEFHLLVFKKNENLSTSKKKFNLNNEIKVIIKGLILSQTALKPDNIDAILEMLKDESLLKSSNDSIVLKINENFKSGLTITLLDLIRNAVENADKTNPYVKIELRKYENVVEILITNNSLMGNIYKDLLENGTEILGGRTSEKIGLRLIHRFCSFCKIKIKVDINEENKTTCVKLKIPENIKIEKDS